MSLRGMRWAQQARPANSGQKLVLMLLADYHNEKHDRCDPAVPTIAYQAVMSERSVRRILVQLEEQGFINREPRPGRSTLYLLVWSRAEGVDAGVTASIYPGQSVTPSEELDPGHIDRGAPDNLSPRTICHPGHQCQDTPDTGDRGPRSPMTGEQVLTGSEQEKARERANPSSPASDGIQSPFAEGMAIVEGVIEAYREAFDGTAAVVPKSPTTGLTQLLAMRCLDLRREGVDPDADYWPRLFRHLARSDFLAGRRAQRTGQPFRLRLDWLLREEEFAKARAHAYCDAGVCPHVHVPTASGATA